MNKSEMFINSLKPEEYKRLLEDYELSDMLLSGKYDGDFFTMSDGDFKKMLESW